jgi:hypothetical protein
MLIHGLYFEICLLEWINVMGCGSGRENKKFFFANIHIVTNKICCGGIILYCYYYWCVLYLLLEGVIIHYIPFPNRNIYWNLQKNLSSCLIIVFKHEFHEINEIGEGDCAKR